jgi:hypothetical protein
MERARFESFSTQLIFMRRQSKFHKKRHRSKAIGLLPFAFFLLPFVATTTTTAREQKKETQIANARLPFEPPEELIYEAEFSKSLLRNISIAEFRFITQRVNLKESSGASAPQLLGDKDAWAEHFRFTAEAVSKGFFVKLFGLTFHQHIESIVSVAPFAVLQTSRLDEQGKRRRTSVATFDQAARKVVWTERDLNDPLRPPRVVTSALNEDESVQDLVSAVYFMRTLRLLPGTSFDLRISDAGRIYQVPVQVVERTVMKTVLGKVGVVRVDPQVFGDERLVRGKGRMSVWYTDDVRRIPIRAELSTDFGTLNLKLTKVNTDKSALASDR